MPNPFVHVELQTDNLGQAKEFYGTLFDWHLEELTTGDPANAYTMVQVGEGTGGGMMTHPEPTAPNMWLPYILVKDVAAYSTKAQSLGATLIKEKTEVPSYGWFSILKDPTGALFALWENTGETA